MARIAVIGPGAIGGTIAAWLAQNPSNEITVCARTPFECLRLTTPDGAVEERVAVLTAPEDAHPVDWVVVATKAYDSASAAGWFPGLLGGGAHVAILQNGIEHRERFAGLVPADKILPAIVDIPAERTGPGCMLQRRYGWIAVPDEPGGRDFVRLFDHTPIKVAAAVDFEAVAWWKLAVNCAGAVSALALKPAGIAHDEAVAEVMRGLVGECVAVARAEGVTLPGDMPDQVVAHYRESSPDSVNSLHADRLAGRPMEADARNGVIVRIGRRHGIEAPLNQMAAALLLAA